MEYVLIAHLCYNFKQLNQFNITYNDAMISNIMAVNGMLQFRSKTLPKVYLRPEIDGITTLTYATQLSKGSECGLQMDWTLWWASISIQCLRYRLSPVVFFEGHPNGHWVARFAPPSWRSTLTRVPTTLPIPRFRKQDHGRIQLWRNETSPKSLWILLQRVNPRHECQVDLTSLESLSSHSHHSFWIHTNFQN